VKLVVSLDVEADNQWDHGAPLATRNVQCWEPFQELCSSHGVIPTYLLTSEVVADERARQLLTEWRERGLVEIGAHLHPWTTPPFADLPGLRFNDEIHAFPSQLPDELLREKLLVLTGQITERFGIPPTSFRAGRFGFDARVAQYLAEARYVTDSSVTPLISWRDTTGIGAGGPDFSSRSIEPFRIAGTGEPGLVELPVTVVQTYEILDRYPTLLRAYRSLPARAVRRTLLRRWLRPQPMWLTPRPDYDADDLACVWRRAEAAGAEVAVMMFHSSELMPGGSPFRPTASSVHELYTCLDRFFAYVHRCGGRFVGLTDAALGLSSNGLKVRRL
jgi:hypothetical protein